MGPGEINHSLTGTFNLHFGIKAQMDYILHSFGAANTSFNDVFTCLNVLQNNTNAEYNNRRRMYSNIVSTQSVKAERFLT